MTLTLRTAHPFLVGLPKQQTALGCLTGAGPCSLFPARSCNKQYQWLSASTVHSTVTKTSLLYHLCDVGSAFLTLACLHRQGSSQYWPSSSPANTPGSRWGIAPGTLPHKLYGTNPEEAASQGYHLLGLAQKEAMPYCCSQQFLQTTVEVRRHCPALHTNPLVLVLTLLLSTHKQTLHEHVHVLYMKTLSYMQVHKQVSQ